MTPIGKEALVELAEAAKRGELNNEQAYRALARASYTVGALIKKNRYLAHLISDLSKEYKA